MQKPAHDTSIHPDQPVQSRPNASSPAYSLVVATDRAWESDIDQLRINAYLKAGYFKLPNPDPVRRRADPPDSFCLLVLGPRKTLAATVRIAYVHNQRAAESVLQGPVPLTSNDFPSITLCRGATDPQYRGQGLMTFLVSLGVEVAYRSGVRSAIGMQADGTPHFRAIQEASWQCVDVATEFAHTVSFDTATMKLCYLRKDRMVTSVEHSRRRHANILGPAQTDRAIGEAAMVVRKLAKS